MNRPTPPRRGADKPQPDRPGPGDPGPDDRGTDDESFELAWTAWRHFFALRLDQPAPTQPEIDGRLLRYRRAHQAAGLAAFAAALVIAAGITRALTVAVTTLGQHPPQSSTAVLLLLLTAVLLVVLAQTALQHMRAALGARALAQRIDLRTLEPSHLARLFADVADPEVRTYLLAVRAQARPLRRAEAAVVLERARGARVPDDASRAAFEQALRARHGVRVRELAIAAACALVLFGSQGGPAVPGDVLLPGLYLLGAAALADLPHSLVQLVVDPWQLAGGGSVCRRLRARLAADLAPQLAVFLVVVLTVTRLG